MSDFIKIGEIGDILKNAKSIPGNILQSRSSATNSPAVNNSGKRIAFALGLLIAGIIGYELYLYYKRDQEKKKKHV